MERYRVLFYGDRRPDPPYTPPPSEKARRLLIHVLGQRTYEEAMFLTHGWTVIQSRRFPRFDYWLNLINPVGFRVCRHGEGLHGFCVANICIQTVTLYDGVFLPAEDAALAMYLLASYQEDRMLEIGNPDRQWY